LTLATPHDERLREFHKLIEAARRQLKVQHAARRAMEEEEEEEEEA